MRIMSFLNLLLVLIFLGCDIPKEEKVENNLHKSLNYQTMKDSIYCIRDNRIYIDSLKPYFKFKDIERLDKVCAFIQVSGISSFTPIVFSAKKIKVEFRIDTIYLGNYQYLVGNLKKGLSQYDILVFFNYEEDWGYDLFLVSVDNNHQIIDIEVVCSYGGDGGDFTSTAIKYKGKSTYSFIDTTGHETLTEPFDTTFYEKVRGELIITDEGFLERKIIRKDSNIIEIEKVKK